MSRRDNKPAYAAVLSALLSGRPMQIGYSLSQGASGTLCVVNWFHAK